MNARFPVTLQENGSGASADAPILLEGMKVLFDDKVSLYPVELVAKPTGQPTQTTQPYGT